MKYGFTTGSCAAAASKASLYMLLTGEDIKTVSVNTPGGIEFTTEILDIKRGDGYVSCAVKKDGGDDPDITTGLYIYSKVSLYECKGVKITGGEGVGKVTKPGLDQPVGEYAINSVPRKMIISEIESVLDELDYDAGVRVEISVPEGKEIAEKTFNPKLGIEGGISIIGTSGIVEPMSTKAVLDTIKTFLDQRHALGYDYVAISPGNYGLEFMKKTYGYDLDKSVKCSNFIGASAKMALEAGFKQVLYTGHIGKMIKVAGGIMNTHSREADCRMEILSALSIRHYIDPDTVRNILDCVTTEEAVKLIEETGKLKEVMNDAVERICKKLMEHTGNKIQIECIIFSNEMGELGSSKGAGELIQKLSEE